MTLAGNASHQRNDTEVADRSSARRIGRSATNDAERRNRGNPGHVLSPRATGRGVRLLPPGGAMTAAPWVRSRSAMSGTSSWLAPARSIRDPASSTVYSGLCPFRSWKTRVGDQAKRRGQRLWPAPSHSDAVHRHGRGPQTPAAPWWNRPGDRRVPQAPPVRVGAPVRAGARPVPGRGHGQARAGRARWHQAAGERVAAQGDELCADEREGEDPRPGGDRPVGRGRSDRPGRGRKYGKDRRGDELPEQLRRRETRLAKIREAKQALEDEARDARRPPRRRRPRRRARTRRPPRSGSLRPVRPRCRGRRRNGTSPIRSRRS